MAGMQDGNTFYDTWVASAKTANTETLSGAKTLTDSDAQIQYLDPGGAGRNVNCPAPADTNHPFFLYNTADAAENLTVKNSGGTTLVTVQQGELGIVISDGTTTKAFVMSAAGGVPQYACVMQYQGAALSGYTDLSATIGGRYLVAMRNGGTLAGTVGASAMTDQQNIAHGHAQNIGSAANNVAITHTVCAANASNSGLGARVGAGASNVYDMNSGVQAVSTGDFAPYVQMRVLEKP